MGLINWTARGSANVTETLLNMNKQNNQLEIKDFIKQLYSLHKTYSGTKIKKILASPEVYYDLLFSGDCFYFRFPEKITKETPAKIYGIDLILDKSMEPGFFEIEV